MKDIFIQQRRNLFAAVLAVKSPQALRWHISQATRKVILQQGQGIFFVSLPFMLDICGRV